MQQPVLDLGPGGRDPPGFRPAGSPAATLSAPAQSGMSGVVTTEAPPPSQSPVRQDRSTGLGPLEQATQPASTVTAPPSQSPARKESGLAEGESFSPAYVPEEDKPKRRVVTTLVGPPNPNPPVETEPASPEQVKPLSTTPRRKSGKKRRNRRLYSASSSSHSSQGEEEEDDPRYRPHSSSRSSPEEEGGKGLIEVIVRSGPQWSGPRNRIAPGIVTTRRRHAGGVCRAALRAETPPLGLPVAGNGSGRL